MSTYGRAHAFGVLCRQGSSDGASIDPATRSFTRVISLPNSHSSTQSLDGFVVLRGPAKASQAASAEAAAPSERAALEDREPDGGATETEQAVPEHQEESATEADEPSASHPAGRHKKLQVLAARRIINYCPSHFL